MKITISKELPNFVHQFHWVMFNFDLQGHMAYAVERFTGEKFILTTDEPFEASPSHCYIALLKIRTEPRPMYSILDDCPYMIATNVWDVTDRKWMFGP
jgi:hypothetical protein